MSSQDVHAEKRRKKPDQNSHIASLIADRIACLRDLSELAAAGEYIPAPSDLWTGCALFGGGILSDARQLQRSLAAEEGPHYAAVLAALNDFLLTPSQSLARAFYRLCHQHGELEIAARGELYAAMLGDRQAGLGLHTHLWADPDLHLLECMRRGLHSMTSRVDPDSRNGEFQTVTIVVGMNSMRDDALIAVAVTAGMTQADNAIDEAAAAERHAEQDAAIQEEIDSESIFVDDYSDVGQIGPGDAYRESPEFEENLKASMRAKLAEIAAKPAIPSLLVLHAFEKISGSGAAHTDRQSLAKLYSPIAGTHTDLVVANDIAEIRHDLLASWPHAAEIVDILLRDLLPGAPLRIRPTLLVGPPGSGKTSLLREIAGHFECPVTVYPCASVSDGSFGGTPAQWLSRRASVPLEMIRQNKVANPILILDEIEKAGTGGHNGELVHALLPMLETHTAAEYFEVGLEVPSNLSAVTFLATANSLTIPAPLRDRFRILQMPEAKPEHAGVLSRRIIQSIAMDAGQVFTGWIPPLDGDELEVIQHAWGGGSLRRLRTAIEATLSVRDRLGVMQ